MEKGRISLDQPTPSETCAFRARPKSPPEHHLSGLAQPAGLCRYCSNHGRVWSAAGPLHTGKNSPSFVPEPGKLWIGSLVIDRKSWEQMIEFWKGALGYEFYYPPSEDWALLYDRQGNGPNISFQNDPTSPTGTYRYHFDLHPSDPENGMQRLLMPGVEMKQPAHEGSDYVTLADPDGNPFDVIETPGFGFGPRVH